MLFMRGLALCVLLSSGCDTLFGLEDVPPAADARACGSTDEDGDGVADDCDVCPGIPDPLQADDDGDGVGTVCDPNASTAEALTHFDSFVEASAWSPVGSSAWTFGDGSVAHESTDALGELQYSGLESSSDLTIEAGFTFTSWADQTSAPNIGIRVDASDAMATGHVCGVTPYSSFSSRDTANITEDAGSALDFNIDALQAGQKVTVSATRTFAPDTIRCRVLVDGIEVSSTVKTGSGPFPAAGHVGVRAPRASAVLHYVAVYTRR